MMGLVPNPVILLFSGYFVFMFCYKFKRGITSQPCTRSGGCILSELDSSYGLAVEVTQDPGGCCGLFSQRVPASQPCLIQVHW